MGKQIDTTDRQTQADKQKQTNTSRPTRTHNHVHLPRNCFLKNIGEGRSTLSSYHHFCVFIKSIQNYNTKVDFLFEIQIFDNFLALWLYFVVFCCSNSRQPWNDWRTINRHSYWLQFIFIFSIFGGIFYFWEDRQLVLPKNYFLRKCAKVKSTFRAILRTAKIPSFKFILSARKPNSPQRVLKEAESSPSNSL